MTLTQALIWNKGEPVEQLDGDSLETSGIKPRAHGKRRRNKPQVVGLAHSSDETLETE
jgi:hypothetical protein